ncbi:enoyl-CoA hydratase/isomerase family protein [Pseudomonas lopnurensis]|uniref:enoyl-CoA hydratase/isomerase family protein n=1 Tax=Pseudomonas lopnurensis TaxID=1477517 RepID=UPI0028A7C84F|nr:enoyl-CoA hydratase/isomerase family protein [Pseudomonas lopnurensis]
MAYETLIYEVTPDHVATITINRPQALNAFTLQMRHEFEDAWKRIREDDQVHAVVLRAAEGRAFSTGADVKTAAIENVLGSDNLWNGTDPGDSLGPRSNKVWKPVITAVHGLCCAGAFYWLNESDIIICSDDAQFFDPHVSYGMVCAVEPIGMSYRLPLQEVLRIALLGNDERISPATALRIGLVSEVLPLDKLWNRAHELAAKIANKPPAAVQGTVRAIWESLDLPRKEAINHGLRYCLLGNPIAQAELDIDALRKQTKTFDVR